MERIEQVLQMLNDDKNDSFLNYAYGLELVKLQRYQEAIAAFQKVIELDETYVAAYYQIAIIFIHIDIVDVAKTYIQKGIEQAQLKKDIKAKGELAELLESID